MARRAAGTQVRAKEDKAAETRLTLRLDFPDLGRLGPGKVRLLELIVELGSISAAGRQMGMSYRRAWQLVDDLNTIFGSVVATQQGGARGGGAGLTQTGKDIVRAYRAIEKKAQKAAAAEIALIGRARR
ncbi:LysR family transcriptional regulator [Parvibaculum sp.]|uniref:winged helix-turn-helix domain-containing protein n=1 Tax=Parvibaculum sp. TaxID=2024848 RepID=UPI002C066287|nr:LysR family transcriptional regulator [Parvibaculum sp.]HUD52037.1 LysR family transcriptional regulator [Parvibaculum sp.]